MQRSDELINKIKEALKDCDMSFIVCACVSGSYILPFVSDPKDLDIRFVISKEYPDKMRHRKLLGPIREALTEKIGAFINVLPMPEEHFSGIDAVKIYDDIEDPIRQHCYMPAWAYLIHFLIPVYGDIKHEYPQFDILDEDKIDYLKNLRDEINSERFKHSMKKTGRTKRLYHVLCGIYFIENGSYELTEEQKKNVNIAHDKTDGWEGLYEWAKEELEKLVQ